METTRCNHIFCHSMQCNIFLFVGQPTEIKVSFSCWIPSENSRVVHMIYLLHQLDKMALWTIAFCLASMLGKKNNTGRN